MKLAIISDNSAISIFKFQASNTSIYLPFKKSRLNNQNTNKA